MHDVDIENKIENDCVELIEIVWNNIDWDTVAGKRRMQIYDELTSKIKSACMTSDLKTFLVKICNKFGIRSISNGYDKVYKIVNSEYKSEILKTLRDKTPYLITCFRYKKEVGKHD